MIVPFFSSFIYLFSLSLFFLYATVFEATFVALLFSLSAFKLLLELLVLRRFFFLLLFEVSTLPLMEFVIPLKPKVDKFPAFLDDAELDFFNWIFS